MANYIEMTVRGAIATLCNRGWSNSRIARELGIHRETVARYKRLGPEPAEEITGEESKPSIPPAGNDAAKPSIVPPGNDGSKCTIPPAGKPGRRSQCEAYGEPIDLALEKGLSAQRIFQDLVCDYGFEGSYDCVKRYLRKKKAANPSRIWRMETLPAEEAQVDFGTGAWIKGSDGRKRRSWIFRIVLSCSRKGYAEAVFRQDTETFIRCIENAFRHFGGVTHTLSIDNLRAAVSKADWYEPEINPKLESFCRHYGTVVLPCRVRKPEHKGKVESSVKYVKQNALKGHEFATLAEENRHLLRWEQTVADCRIHGTTRQQIRKRFVEIEKPALLPLPMNLFPCYQEGRRNVHRDSHVEVDRAYYEVPTEYIGQEVWVRWDSRLVRVFNQRFEQLVVLAHQEPGTFTKPLGVRGRPAGGAGRSKAYWLKRCARMGEHCGVWALEVIAERGSTGIRSLQGLVHMVGQHSCHLLDQACERALSHGAYRLKDLRRLIEQPSTQQPLSFMTNHPLIRDMAEYTEFLDTLYPDYENIEEAVQ